MPHFVQIKHHQICSLPCSRSVRSAFHLLMVRMRRECVWKWPKNVESTKNRNNCLRAASYDIWKKRTPFYKMWKWKTNWKRYREKNTDRKERQTICHVNRHITGLPNNITINFCKQIRGEMRQQQIEWISITSANKTHTETIHTETISIEWMYVCTESEAIFCSHHLFLAFAISCHFCIHSNIFRPKRKKTTTGKFTKFFSPFFFL